MRVPAHCTNEQMRFTLMGLGAGSHRIQTARQRPQQAKQLLRRKLFLIRLEQIDELAIESECRETITVEQRFNVGAARQLGVVIDGCA